MDSPPSYDTASNHIVDNNPENRNIYRLLKDAPSAIALLEGPDHTYTFANNLYLKIINRTEEQLIGKSLKQVFPEVEGQGIFNLFDEVYKTQQPFVATEFPATFHDGGNTKTGYYNFMIQPVQNETGKQHGLMVHLNDVTEYVAARKRAEESESKYRSLFDSMDEGFCVIEVIFDKDDVAVDYLFLEVNRIFEMQSGLKDAPGKTARQLVPDLEERWFRIYGEVAKTGKPAKFSEGSEAMGQWFEVDAFRLGNEGSRKVAVMFTNVTMRKAEEKVFQENQQLLQTIFDASPNALCVYEPVVNKSGDIADFRFIMVNGFMVQATGRNDLPGKLYSGEFPEIRQTGILDKLENVFDTGRSLDFEQWEEKDGVRRCARIIINKVGKLLVVTTEDITARKEAEEGLRKSEDYFRQLTDTVPAIIWITRPEGYCTYLNKNWYEFTGQTEGEAEGFGWLEATHPDDAEEAGRRFLEATEKQQPYYILYRLRHHSGEYRWAIDSGQPKFSQDGIFDGMIGTVIDVHEQKLAEDKIRESEIRFRSMADASPVMIWTLDENGNSTYYNSRAREFTGHTENDLQQGKSWQVAIHPEDIEYASGVVKNAVINRVPYQMECRMQRADGDWRWLLNQGIPRFGIKGEYFGFVGSSIDITEHKNSQQELKTALEQIRLSKEAAELGTFDMDLEAGTMHWDDRCRILFGISHHGPVTYEKDFSGGLHPDDRERILKIIDRLFIRSISNGDYDVEYRTVGAEDGIVRWVRAKGKVYFNEQDKPVRFIGSVLDITEKMMAIQRIEALVEERTRELARTNDALQNTNKELQRSNENLEEFAHAASHDLKEPVRKIHFFTNQLKDQLISHLQDTEIRSFNRIEKATLRMGNLIDDLLLYSHVSHRPHETEDVDLNQKVQNVLEDLELDITEKKAVINVGKLPVIKGYRRQLQQLFQNMISNALKYSKADVPPRIDISASPVKENGVDYQQITIKDNGIGFEQIYADKIFKMFTRLHGKAEYSGTGVGLSIVKKVVENHNGKISVESEPGEGTSFKILLPVE